MPTAVDQAVCVRQWDWSETSQTVSLFARGAGLFRALAKGARRPRARFSGGLETLTAGEVVAIIKPGPVLATLTAWDLREVFPALRQSLAAFHAGLFLADLVQHAFTEHDPHPAVYDSLVATLRALSHLERPNHHAVLRFQWCLLAEMGYRPDLSVDALTGGALAPAPAYGFAPHRGGLTSDPGSGRPGAALLWRVRASTVDLLRSIESDAPVDLDGARRANRLLAAYLREVLGRDLPSAAPFLALNLAASPDPG